MNKYELALVVNAKIEDDARTAAVDKVKALIERFGGTITNVDEWGKKNKTVAFTKLITDSNKNKSTNYNEKQVSYLYEFNNYSFYRAIPLSNNIIKIEAWRIDEGLLWDKILYYYDVMVINTNLTHTHFSWTDDEHTSFSITMNDKQNGWGWEDDKLVYFIIEDESLMSQKDGNNEIIDATQDDEYIKDYVKTPISSMDCEGLIYSDVVKMFEDAGFLNVQANGIEVEYLETVDDGSVIIISINDEPFDKFQEFDKESTVVMQYRIQVKADEDNSLKEIVFPEQGSKLDRDYDSKGTNTVWYINVDGTSNKPKLAKWGKATVTDGVKEYLEYLENLGFRVEITKMQKEEPYSGFYTYETSFKVSNEYVTWTMYHYIQDEDFVEYQLDIYLTE